MTRIAQEQEPRNDQDSGLCDCGPIACGICFENDALPETLDSLLEQACLLRKEKWTHDSDIDQGN